MDAPLIPEWSNDTNGKETASVAQEQFRKDSVLSGSSEKHRFRDGWEWYTNPTRFVALYRRFPATFTLLAPYVLLILPPAFAFGNPAVWFLIGVALIAVAGSLLADLRRPKLKGSGSPISSVGEYGRGLVYLSFFAITTSSIAGVAAAYSGKGSVAVQTGLAEISSGFVGTIDSLLRGWVVVGVGMLFAAYVGGQCSRIFFFVTLSIPVLTGSISAYLTQITAPLFELVTFLAMISLLFGVVRARIIIIGILATLVLWPAVFEIRNELRTEDGVRVSETVTAFDRLRFDVQFARAQELQVPLDIEVSGYLQNPTPLDVLRFGVVPRFLDPSRELVSTGHVINVALGGSITSAYTFGPVTTAYVLEGPVYLFLYYFLLAVFVNLIWRRGTRITPMRLILLALVISGPLGWFSTFPDSIIGMLQSLVSAIPLIVVLHGLRGVHRKEAKRQHKRSPNCRGQLDKTATAQGLNGRRAASR